MAANRDTDWVRRCWDRSAATYDRSMGWFERRLLGDGRRWVASQARGRTLEVGIGTGRNLPYYPSDIDLTGIDLSEAMLDVARERARELDRKIDLRVGDAEHLEFPEAAFDTVVFTLALCSIPNDGEAIRESRRVLRPGGRVILLEHVRSPRRWVRAVEMLVGFFTARLQGDHMLREPLEHLRREGFRVEIVKRSAAGFIERTAARKPG